MAWRENRGSTILLCLGLVVSSSFCHCKPLTKLKAPHKLGGNTTLSKDQAKGSDLQHGKLLIGKNSLQRNKLKGTKATKNFLGDEADYQDDMGWGEHKQPGQVDGPNLMLDSLAVDRLLKMEPKVECTGDSMKLQVQDTASTPGSLLFVDRGSRLSPLPLSKLPQSCGYTIRSTPKVMLLVAPYDGCFVALEEDSYVLPLRWWGLPVRMSCPLIERSSPNPPMVTCHAKGMIVKTGWALSVAKINVNVNSKWEPLMKASARCGFSIVEHPEGVVISAHYAPCLEIKDGMYILELAGDGETTVSCPPLSPAQIEHTKKPASGPQQQIEMPSKGVYPPTPSLIKPAQSAVPQVPTFPKNPEVPNPNQGPRYIPGPEFPYYPFHYPAKPDPKLTPTTQPFQQTDPPTELLVTANGQVPQTFITLPWPAQPEKVPVQPPAPQNPNGQGKQPFYPYPFYVKPPSYPPVAENPPTLPPVTKPPPGKTNPLEPQTGSPQVYQLFHPYPWQMPEKPTVAPKPPQPEAHQGQIHQPFYPFYYQPVPEKPTAAPKPPQPEAPQGQVHQQFHPYPWQTTEKPTAAPKPPQPEATQGQVHQLFYPYPWQTPEKPTAAPKPPQPEAPQGQVHQQFHPYPWQTPEKPTSAPKPPQPEAPQCQVHQQFHPYPWQTPEKPTAAPKPPQPEATQGQVHQQFHPYPCQTPEKPTAAPKPPQPEATQGQVHQQFHPYPWQTPEKPNPAPKPPQPEAPQGQVHQLFHPYPWQTPEKPTAAPKPPQPEAPRGQVHQTFHPYPWQTPEKPTVAPKPPQPEAPQGQVHHLFHPYPWQMPEKPTAAPKPPQPEAPQGQVHQTFHPYPWQTPEKPTVAPKPPPPEAPQGQVHQLFHPYPWQTPEKPTVAPKPPQPEAPQGQVHQLFHPYPWQTPEKPTVAPKPPQPEPPQGQVHQTFHPYPWQTPEKPTVAPKPPQPEPPQGQVHQTFHPYPWQTPEKPTVAPKPPQPEPPQGQVHQTFHPYPWQTPEKPTAAPKPPPPEAPQGQVHQPFHPYPWQTPEKPTIAPKPPPPEAPQGQVHQPFKPLPQPEPEKPTSAPKHPKPDPPQPGSSYMPHVYCPQFCPSYCCPQIAFHQHLHQIVPVGRDSKEAPSLYPGLPFLPSMAYSGFSSGFGSPTAQKPTEAVTMQTSTSATNSFQSVPSGNEKLLYVLPPDGKPAIVLQNPSKLTNPEQPINTLVPNSYPNWPYLALNQEMQKQPYHKMDSQSKGPLHPKFQHERDRLLVPYYMHQDGQAQIHDKSIAVVNTSQPQSFVRGPKTSTKQERTVHSFSEPKSYVLLQHGPPGRDPDSLNNSGDSLRDVFQDAQNPVRNNYGKTTHHKNKTLQEKPQHPIWLGKGMSNPFADVNYMPMPGDKSETLPLSIPLDGPHLVNLPQDPSVSVAHLNPKFQYFWRPMTPLDSEQRVPPHAPGNAFQRGNSVAHQRKGLNQPIQSDGGNRNQK